MSTTLPDQFGTPEKKRPIPARVRQAVEEIVQGRAKTITAAARKVGLTREHLSRELSKPHITEHVRQKAARTVAIGAGRASAKMVALMDAKSEHVSFDAAKHVAAIAGIQPAAEANVNFNVQVPAGYILDLTEPSDPPMRIVSPTTTGANDG